MAKTNRNNPKNAKSSDATTTLFDFERRFPDDASCLETLVGMLYPDGIHCPTCEKVTKHHRVRSRTCYECQFCGHQEYPMKGTIFEGSSTSLRLWFYAMYLMASTRCGISAKQLEREIGVSYPTAHRMFKKIRSLLSPDDEQFGGTVEMDHAYIGGRAKWRTGARSRARGVVAGGTADKVTVIGMAQRGTDGATGKVHASIVKDTTRFSTTPVMLRKVLPATTIYTDEHPNFRGLDKGGFPHHRVNHTQEIYVAGDVHVNTIEGFWSLLKRGISGVYHGVSTKHLQSYLDEYTFRYNNRDDQSGMFNAFLNRIEKNPDSAS